LFNQAVYGARLHFFDPDTDSDTDPDERLRGQAVYWEIVRLRQRQRFFSPSPPLLLYRSAVIQPGLLRGAVYRTSNFCYNFFTMKILLCNDDGIDAKGLKVLAETLSSRVELFIAAPDTERSAVGHAITIIDPLKVKEHYHNDELFGYAVSGTPADCVKLALNSLMEKKPDLIVSGINQGANLGTDIIYSGTVSAATEGTLLGIPSIAVSINSYERTARFDTAAQIVCELLDFLPEFSVPEGTLLNVNVPNIPREDVCGFRITSQGKSKYVEEYVQRIDPRGNVYYWINGSLGEIEEEEHADYRAIHDNCVSITPIHFDVTNYDFMHAVKASLEKKLNPHKPE